jgi:hypothetical protein
VRSSRYVPISLFMPSNCLIHLLNLGRCIRGCYSEAWPHQASAQTFDVCEEACVFYVSCSALNLTRLPDANLTLKFNAQWRRASTMFPKQSLYRRRSRQVSPFLAQFLLNLTLIPLQLNSSWKSRATQSDDEDMVCVNLKVDFMTPNSSLKIGW